MDVNLRWVKVPVGIIGSELADQAEKKALDGEVYKGLRILRSHIRLHRRRSCCPDGSVVGITRRDRKTRSLSPATSEVQEAMEIPYFDSKYNESWSLPGIFPKIQRLKTSLQNIQSVRRYVGA